MLTRTVDQVRDILQEYRQDSRTACVYGQVFDPLLKRMEKILLKRRMEKMHSSRASYAESGQEEPLIFRTKIGWPREGIIKSLCCISDHPLSSGF